jgi:hypothetical protein
VVATQDAALINNFRVYVSNSGARAYGWYPWRSTYYECGRRYTAIQGPNVIQCGRRRGRYVYVSVEKVTAIALREVEVYTKIITE